MSHFLNTKLMNTDLWKAALLEMLLAVLQEVLTPVSVDIM